MLFAVALQSLSEQQVMLFTLPRTAHILQTRSENSTEEEGSWPCVLRSTGERMPHHCYANALLRSIPYRSVPDKAQRELHQPLQYLLRFSCARSRGSVPPRLSANFIDFFTAVIGSPALAPTEACHRGSARTSSPALAPTEACLKRLSAHFIFVISLLSIQ